MPLAAPEELKLVDGTFKFTLQITINFYTNIFLFKFIKLCLHNHEMSTKGNTFLFVCLFSQNPTPKALNYPFKENLKSWYIQELLYLVFVQSIRKDFHSSVN